MEKLQKEKLNDLYLSPNTVRVFKSRRMIWAENVARMDEARGVHRVLVGESEEKSALGRSRRRGVDNIKVEFRNW
jgi:hypothetical protein